MSANNTSVTPCGYVIFKRSGQFKVHFDLGDPLAETSHYLARYMNIPVIHSSVIYDLRDFDKVSRVIDTANRTGRLNLESLESTLVPSNN